MVEGNARATWAGIKTRTNVPLKGGEKNQSPVRMRGCAPLHPTNWMSYSPASRQGEVTTFLLGERQTMLWWRTHTTHSASGRRWSFDARKRSGTDNISGGLLVQPQPSSVFHSLPQCFPKSFVHPLPMTAGRSLSLHRYFKHPQAVFAQLGVEKLFCSHCETPTGCPRLCRQLSGLRRYMDVCIVNMHRTTNTFTAGLVAH